jgi:hypothetical protein
MKGRQLPKNSVSNRSIYYSWMKAKTGTKMNLANLKDLIISTSKTREEMLKEMKISKGGHEISSVKL